jgi:hypothetical protein
MCKRIKVKRTLNDEKKSICYKNESNKNYETLKSLRYTFAFCLSQHYDYYELQSVNYSSTKCCRHATEQSVLIVLNVYPRTWSDSHVIHI